MTRPIPCLAVLATTALSAPAMADVTAVQVWDSWKSLLTDIPGVELGTEAISGRAITVTGTTYSFVDINNRMDMVVDELVFAENGDGTVSIIFSNDIPITFSPDDGSETPEVRVSHKGLEVIASGTPDAIGYAMVADSLSVAAEPGSYDGGDVEALEMILSRFDGTFSLSQGEMISLRYDLGLDLAIDARFRDGTEDYSVRVNLDDLATTSESVFPMALLENPEQFETGIPEFALSGSAGVKTARVEMDIATPTETVVGTVSLTDVAIGVDGASGDAMAFGYNIDMGPASADITVDSGPSDAGAVTLQMDGGRTALAVELPMAAMARGADFEDLTPAELDLLNVDVSSELGRYELSFAGQIEGETGQMALSADGGRTDLAFSSAGLDISGAAEALKANVAGFQVPIAVDVAMERAGYRFALPLAPSDEMQEVAARLEIRDLSISDGLWSLFDPVEILPREALTVAFDISGLARPLVSLLDESQFGGPAMEQMPMELGEVQLHDLEIRGAGAEITGSGAFTFDNDDLQSFAGFPAPEGALTLSATGVNGLLDKLITMGLLQQDQAMGARMAMGMIARSVGEDALASDIEVNGEGHVIVNGQRMR